MPSASSHPTSIFFADRSALQILRAAQAQATTLPKSTISELPPRAPLRDEVLDAIARTEAAFPSLSLRRPVQVLVGGAARCRANDQYRSSACSAKLSRGSFLRVGAGLYVCSPALAFVRAAAQGLADVALLELGFELCGTYRSELTCGRAGYGVGALATSDDLLDYAARNPSVVGVSRAARLAGRVCDGSASPRETKLALLLGLPLTQGGGGLGMPLMNHVVVASREAALIARRASFRCDLCWPQAKVDVEYQSREIHSNEMSRIDDSRRTNALESMGWQVVNVTNDELDDASACDVIAQTIRRRLGKDMRIRTKNYYSRRMALRAELGLRIDTWSA